MSATNPAVLSEGRSKGESFGSVTLTVSLLLLLVGWMVFFNDRWIDVWVVNWPALLFWIAVVVVIDSFPIKVGPLFFTLDVPVLLAVALLHTPEVAASVASLAALDLREFRGRVHLSRAIFNRAQIALSVLFAGHVLHLFSPTVDRIQSLILPTLAALLADYAVNATLVALVRVVDGSAASFARELWRLKVGSWWEFLGTYFAYGLLAILFATLYVDAGGWPVSILLVSALVARQSLTRTRQLERLGRDLTTNQQLLMRALDRVVEERRDERLLIGGQLHDDVLQSIIRARMGMMTIKSNPRDPAGIGASLDEDLREIDQATKAAHDGLRQVIRGLRESPLGPHGLVPSLSTLAKELRHEWRTPIRVELPDEVDIDAVQQVVLYQAAREAVLNALKHAEAKLVRVRLDLSEREAVLEVLDDGIGYVPSDYSQEELHFGMALLQERVSALGGSVSIEGIRNHGTRVSVRLPLTRS